MPARNWIVTVVIAACAWAVGVYMGGTALEQPRMAADVSAGNFGRGPNGGVRQTGREHDSTDALPPSIHSFSERLRALGGKGSSRWRREQAQRLADEIPIDDIPALVQELDWSFSPEAGEVLELLFVRWAAENPRKATEYALHPPVSSTYWQGLRGAISEWTSIDPVAAQNWAKALAPGPIRNQLLAMIATELARSDPAASFQLLNEDVSTSSREYRYAEVISRWAKLDPIAAAAAVESMEAGHLRNSSAITLHSSEIWRPTAERRDRARSAKRSRAGDCPESKNVV